MAECHWSKLLIYDHDEKYAGISGIKFVFGPLEKYVHCTEVKVHHEIIRTEQRGKL